MNRYLLMLLAMLVSVPAFAEKPPEPTVDSVTIPAPHEKDKPASLVLYDLPNDTIVKHYDFSMKVPKGWSIEAAGYAAPPANTVDHADELVTAAPINDIEDSSVTIGVREIHRDKKIPLEEELKIRAKTNKHPRFVSWHGQQWLLLIYKAHDKKAGAVRMWCAFAVKGGKEYMVVAAVPETLIKQYRPTVLFALNSIELN